MGGCFLWRWPVHSAPVRFVLTEEGEGGDAYEVSLPLERLSVDTQAGAHGTLPTDIHRKPPKSIVPKKQRSWNALGTAAAGGPESPLQPDSRKNPNRDCQNSVVS